MNEFAIIEKVTGQLGIQIIGEFEEIIHEVIDSLGVYFLHFNLILFLLHVVDLLYKRLFVGIPCSIKSSLNVFDDLLIFLNLFVESNYFFLSHKLAFEVLQVFAHVGQALIVFFVHFQMLFFIDGFIHLLINTSVDFEQRKPKDQIKEVAHQARYLEKRAP